ncbi:MAG: 6-phosphofructokinase 1 [Phenylobacterium sp.]|jgi:6-phosphofructokinase 1
MKTLKKVAILTSGGDAPGMNACIRSITLTALAHNLTVVGFKHGYNGLLANEQQPLNEKIVRQVIHLGGTLLKSARCPQFVEVAAAKKAAAVLDSSDIDVLFVIGGDGSFMGAQHLANHWQGQIIGLPGTIDNDIDGTDTTIGYYTAMDTALDAIDKIRDTADAFERIFIVEVMGRNSGFLALNVGIACAAEQIICNDFYPDGKVELSAIIEHIQQALVTRHDSSYIIVLMENLWPGGAAGLAQTLNEQLHVDCRPCVLGYIQRGGSPVSKDRIVATKLGAAAVEAALNGEDAVMIGELNGQLSIYPLAKTGLQQKTVDPFLLRIQQTIFDNGDNVDKSSEHKPLS